MVLKVLKFGTQKLFEDKAGTNDSTKVGSQEATVRKAYEIDFEALDKLLDREAQFEALV